MTQSYDAGFYDLSLFNTHFIEQFAKNPRYNPAALSSMDTLVAMINRDPGITDVRQKTILNVTSGKARPLSLCRKDSAIAKIEKQLR